MTDKGFRQPSNIPNQSHFAQAPSADINRSTFDRSSGLKTTFNAGKIYPIFVDEVLPGDTFDMKTTMFARLATPLKPLFDALSVDIHFWFVPNRLVWDNWEKFMGERDDPSDDPDVYSIPTTPMDSSIWQGSSNDDFLPIYMGMPQQPYSAPINVSALPFRSYRLIWNEWYRDQNAEAKVAFDTGDTDTTNYTDSECLPRYKRRDYFTSALPFAQKGDPVTIPIGVSAPVVGIGTVAAAPWTTGSLLVRETAGDQTYTNFIAPNPTFNAAEMLVIEEGNAGFPGIFADLTNATSITINDLRTAFQVQKLLERDARGGTRYIEIVLSHFNVRSDDARLQRPEFLGGGTSRVSINPVANTVGSDNQGQLLPQGDLAAYGTVLNDNAKWSKSFTEHGHIIGVVSARADLNYQQGIDRMWFRSSRYDFYWPSFAHLGEQEIKNRELFASGDPAQDDGTFAFQERYAEYRYKPSKITGKMSSYNAEPLDVWHLAQEFATLPTWGPQFLYENPPIQRVVAVPSEPDFLADIWFDLKCTRPMPVYSIPGLIDHF